MKGKIFITFIGVVLLLTVSIPLTVLAVSYSPPRYQRKDIVYMFHSGTNDVTSAVHTNDILIIYRIDPSSCIVKEVGRIKVLSFIGETYLKGQVIEGWIKPNDIAKKGKVSCLILSARPCNHY